MQSSFKLLTILIVLFAISISPSPAFGQYIFLERSINCNPSQFYLESEIFSKSDKDSLLHDILQNMDRKRIKHLKGDIFIQIYIDTLGKPCCLSVLNKLNTPSYKLNIEEAINTYTKWSPPFREGKNVRVSAFIKLTFTKKEVYLKRLGSKYNSPWLELESCSARKESY